MAFVSNIPVSLWMSSSEKSSWGKSASKTITPEKTKQEYDANVWQFNLKSGGKSVSRVIYVLSIQLICFIWLVANTTVRPSSKGFFLGKAGRHNFWRGKQTLQMLWMLDSHRAFSSWRPPPSPGSCSTPPFPSSALNGTEATAPAYIRTKILFMLNYYKKSPLWINHVYKLKFYSFLKI